jgi:O-antigen ligase
MRINAKTEYLLFALFMLSIYFSTSISSILSVLIIALWLFSKRILSLPQLLKNNAVAAWAVALFCCFLFGLSYSSGSFQDGLNMLNKYRELLFIPIFMSFLDADDRARKWLWCALVFASGVSLVASFLMEFSLLPLNKQGDPCFKSRITYSIFIAFFAFLCAHKACGTNGRYRSYYWLVVLLCGYNLFFVVQGRTGQLLLVALTFLFAWQRFNNTGRILTVLLLAFLLVFFLGYSEKAVRIKEGVEDTRAYLKQVPEQTDSSMALRYSFWKNSFELLQQKPLLGYGTGSFNKEYSRLIAEKGHDAITANPHNEFLMIGVQLGSVGLLVYFGFLSSLYRSAQTLPQQEKWLANGLIMALIVSSLFNSPLLDHAEGHWFACMIALCFARQLQPAPGLLPALSV